MGEEATCEITVQVVGSGTFENSAEISGNEIDPDPSNNDDDVEVVSQEPPPTTTTSTTTTVPDTTTTTVVVTTSSPEVDDDDDLPLTGARFGELFLAAIALLAAGAVLLIGTRSSEA